MNAVVVASERKERDSRVVVNVEAGGKDLIEHLLLVEKIEGVKSRETTYIEVEGEVG